MTDDSYLNEVQKTRTRTAKQPVQDVTAQTQMGGPIPMVSLNVRISAEQSNLLTSICARQGWSKAHAIREAIRLLEADNA
jgi:hypothetical protein